MKTRLNVRNRLSEEPAPVLEEEGREATIPDGYAVVGLMRGRAASMGTAIGRAAVVRSKEDLARVGKGSVILSEKASPHLAVVMSKACAMATECGGQAGIASGYAREYGIPAVVGVAGLTRVIKEGDLLRVDGTRGVVEIIAPTV